MSTKFQGTQGLLYEIGGWGHGVGPWAVALTYGLGICRNIQNASGPPAPWSEKCESRVTWGKREIARMPCCLPGYEASFHLYIDNATQETHISIFISRDSIV